MITIIDSGGANIASIQFALERLGATAQLSTDAAVIKGSSHVILPGVSSAESAMRILREYSLVELLRSLRQPVLGICLGMQILFDYSKEGDVECLGLIKGNVIKLPTTNKKLAVPHIGWNQLAISNSESIMKNIPDAAYVYFVHSYVAPVGKHTIASTCYGENFSAAIRQDNFYGTQFHPERSSAIGSIILKNFLEL
jgi:glutamine amidotransferase